MDFYLRILFVSHLILVCLYCFRFLKFLITVEISLILIYISFNLLVSKNEVTCLLLFLAIIACEAAIGLALLVRWVRFEDKHNVKSNVFGSF